MGGLADVRQETWTEVAARNTIERAHSVYVIEGGCPSRLYPSTWCILDAGHDEHHRAPKNPYVTRRKARKLRSFDLVWWPDREPRYDENL
jgi:hypothetical protein